MAEDTTKVEAAPTAENQTPEVPDTTDPLRIADQDFQVLGTTHKKGKGKGKVAYYILPDEKVVKNADGSETKITDYQSMYDRLRIAVGPENWDKCLYAEVIRKACNDATAQAIGEAKDGIVSDEALAKALVEWFLPATRRSGTHIKDLREKAQEIFGELNPLLLRHFQHPDANDPEHLKQEEHNRMLQLTLQYSELNQKIEEKSRKGKKAEKPAEKPAAAEVKK